MAGNNDDGDEEWRRCDLCDKTFETKNQSIVHCRGIVHLERTLADERGEDYEQLAEEKKKREGKPEIPKTDAIVLDSMRLDMMDGWDRKSKFYCQVCETDCISEAGYDSHVKGAKHKKRELSQSKFLKGDEDQTATAEANFALLAQPIIGLELIQEVKSRSGDALDYNCHLCGNASLTLFTISSHVISVKHRKKYFQLRHPTVWNKVVAAGKKNANVACQRYAQEVEEEFGRKKIVRVGEEFKETVPDLPPDAEEMVEDTPMAWDQLGDYVCEVCEITCNGENSWNLHVKGAKHKKRALEKAKPGGRLTGKTDAIEANFDTLKEPIIGLEYIEAFQFLDEFHNEERYNCHICTINTLTCDTINAHVISVKHRRRYIKLKYPSFHKDILAAGARNAQQKPMAKKHAQQVEDTFGRKSIIRIGEPIPIYICDLQEMDFEDDPPPVPAYRPKPAQSSSSNVTITGPARARNEIKARYGKRPQADHHDDRSKRRREGIGFDDDRSRSQGRRPRESDERGERHDEPRRSREYDEVSRRQLLQDSEAQRSREIEELRARIDQDRARIDQDRYPQEIEERRGVMGSFGAMMQEYRRTADNGGIRGMMGDGSGMREIMGVGPSTRGMMGDGSGARGMMGNGSQSRFSGFMDGYQQSLGMDRDTRSAPQPLYGAPSTYSAPPTTYPREYHTRGNAPPTSGPPPMGPPPTKHLYHFYPNEDLARNSALATGGMEIVVPPLQSMSAFSDPAVVDDDPWTHAPAVIKKFAEIMFLIKISPMNSNKFKEIAASAFTEERADWRILMSGARTTAFSYDLNLVVEDIRISRGCARGIDVAELQAFQIFVEKARESDYLIIEEGEGRAKQLRMFKSAVGASRGAFRYDLLCQPRNRRKTDLPTCEFCMAVGHIQLFCPTKKMQTYA